MPQVPKYYFCSRKHFFNFSEFLVGDKKIRKISREQAKDQQSQDDTYTKYSRSFKRGQIDPMTFRLRGERSRDEAAADRVSQSEPPVGFRQKILTGQQLQHT